jgi:hypothetical protein
MMTDSAHKCPEGWDATRLLAYVEGELEDGACRQLEQHVKVCPVCAGELESLRRMDSLLKEHPESFHPDEEDLYRFVSQGKDLDGKIAVHLRSCEPCRNDADLLSEMITHRAAPGDRLPAMPRSLVRELARSEPASSPGMVTRLLSAATELLRLPFRMPVLALGSAATILILAVVGLPMWRSLQEHRRAEAPPVQDARVPAHIVPRAAPEKETAAGGALRADHWPAASGVISPNTASEMPAEPHRQKTEVFSSDHRAEEKAAKRELSKRKQELAPSPQSAANVAIPTPDAPPAESKAAPLSAPQKAPVPAALEPGHGGVEPQNAPALGRGKPSLGMSAARSRMHGLHRAAKKDALGFHDESGVGASTPVPITVHVADGQGNPIPWAKVILPSDLERRFHLVISQGTEHDAALDRTSSVKGARTDAQATQQQALHIEIRIHQSADAYDVDSKLYDASSHREIASVVVVRVSRADVPGAIESTVRRLLEHK